jgi:hypothetical protein
MATKKKEETATETKPKVTKAKVVKEEKPKTWFESMQEKINKV